ncbi:doublesex- and mab-3-related transcription factor A2-like [Acipenser ruthenus]|uniref:doublesex- and mab-3-related transcription factor A2-like n=1 Tax=Acipenser ruthenus TaxID=7906 RepID=UPI002741E630|nr:doublesex- and mab-3-related transcription factor A2-like [Acipenser ruthenus]
MPHRPNPDIAEKGLRTPKCARCRNHGFTVQLKGHSGKCAYLHCPCWKCALIAERTQIMAVQRRMKKEQKEETNNAAECEPAPPAQGPRLAGRRKRDKSRNIDEDCCEAEPAGATSARLLNKYEPRRAGASAAQDSPWRGEGGVPRAAVSAGTSRQFDAGRMHTAFGVSAPVQTAAPETALSSASSGVYEARAPMHSCAEGSPGMGFHTGADWPERDGAAWSSGGWAAGGMQENAFRMARRYVPERELLSAVHRPVPVKLYSRCPCHAIFLNVATGQPCFHEPPLPVGFPHFPGHSVQCSLDPAQGSGRASFYAPPSVRPCLVQDASYSLHPDSVSPREEEEASGLCGSQDSDVISVGNEASPQENSG